MLVVVSLLTKLQVHSGGGDSGWSCTQQGCRIHSKWVVLVPTCNSGVGLKVKALGEKGWIVFNNSASLSSVVSDLLRKCITFYNHSGNYKSSVCLPCGQSVLPPPPGQSYSFASFYPVVSVELPTWSTSIIYSWWCHLTVWQQHIKVQLFSKVVLSGQTQHTDSLGFQCHAVIRWGSSSINWNALKPMEHLAAFQQLMK